MIKLFLCFLGACWHLHGATSQAEGVTVFDGAQILVAQALDQLLSVDKSLHDESMDILYQWSLNCAYGREVCGGGFPVNYQHKFNVFQLTMPYTRVRKQMHVDIVDRVRAVVRKVKSDYKKNSDFVSAIETHKNNLIETVAELAYASYCELGIDGIINGIKQYSQFKTMSVEDKKNYSFFRKKKGISLLQGDHQQLACTSEEDRVQQIACMLASITSDTLYPLGTHEWAAFLWRWVLYPALRITALKGYSDHEFDKILKEAAQIAPMLIDKDLYFLPSDKSQSLQQSDAEEAIRRAPFVKRLQIFFQTFARKHPLQESKTALVTIRHFLWMHDILAACTYMAQNKVACACDVITACFAQLFASEDPVSLIPSGDVSLYRAERFHEFIYTQEDNLLVLPPDGQQQNKIDEVTLNQEAYLLEGRQYNPLALRYIHIENAIHELVMQIHILSFRHSELAREKMKQYVGKEGNDRNASLPLPYVLQKYLYTVLGGDDQDSEGLCNAVVHLVPESLKDGFPPALMESIREELWKLAAFWGDYKDDPESVDGKVTVQHMQNSNKKIIEAWRQKERGVRQSASPLFKSSVMKVKVMR